MELSNGGVVESSNSRIDEWLNGGFGGVIESSNYQMGGRVESVESKGGVVKWSNRRISELSNRRMLEW